MLPATKRRSEPPRWEISVGGVVVGWIDEHHLRGTSSVFYFATGIHPENGKEYRLESSVDFEDRIRVLREFHRDPMTSRQHLGLGLMPEWKDRG